MGIILKVPVVRQAKNSVDCGIASLSMLFEFHDIKKNVTDIKKEIEVDEVGTYSPQLGLYLISHGFDVELVTMHPKLFTLKDRNCSQANILNILETARFSPKLKENEKCLNYYQDFLQAGGKIAVKIPSMEDIVGEIDQGRPLGALLTSNFLSGCSPGFNFHFNVITGYDEKHVYANDPLWDMRGGRKKYLTQDFFYGLYASAYGDIDNAMLIKIKKK